LGALPRELEPSERIFEKRERALLASKEISSFVSDSIPLLVTCQSYACVAQRFREELAENAKVVSIVEVLPNAGHNSVVAWSRSKDLLALAAPIGLLGSRGFCAELLRAFSEASGVRLKLFEL